MRVPVSVDIEGIAGVVDWDDTLPGRPGHHAACRLMTDEAADSPHPEVACER